MALPEPIAAAGLLGGYLCWLKRRYAIAGLLLACSLMISETGAVFVVLLAGTTLLDGKRRESAALIAIACVPLALWRLYVGYVLWPAWGAQGFLFNPGDFGLPFAGMAKVWTLIRHGLYYPEISSMARAGSRIRRSSRSAGCLRWPSRSPPRTP